MTDLPSKAPARSTRFFLAILLGLTVLVHGRDVAHDFVDWDDDAMVVKSKFLNPVSLEHLRQMWTGPVEGLYSPVSYTAWSGVALVSRLETPDVHESTLNPMPFHLLNLALHMGCVALVFDILQQLMGALRGNRRETASGDERNASDDARLRLRGTSHQSKLNILPAFFGAAVFAVHPLQVEPIAWIAGMNNLMAAVFSLSCIAVYVRYVLVDKSITRASDGGDGEPAGSAVPEEKSTDVSRAERSAERLYLGATALLVLAFCSKPTAIVTPLVLLAIDGLILRRPMKKLAAALVPLVLVAAPFVWVGRMAQPARYAFRPPAWERPIVAGDAIGFYLEKLVWPHPLLIDYSFRPDWVLAAGGSASHWVAFFLAVCIVAMTWRRARWVAGGFGVFIAGLALVLGLVTFDFQQYSTVADRYAYLSMLGVAILVCGLIANVMNRAPARADSRTAANAAPPAARPWAARVVISLSCAAILAFSWISFRQGAYWADTETLSEHTFNENPSSMAALTMLSYLTEHRGDMEMAKYYNKVGLQHYPDDAVFNRNYANLIRAERPAEAIPHYRKAFDRGDKEPELLNNWGAALLATGHIKEAIEAYNVALADKPDHLTSLINVGRAYLLLHNPGEAEKSLRHALQVDPKSKLAAQYLAQAEAMKKQQP